MHFVVHPSALRSSDITVPGDKSISHRALMLGAVATGRTRITGFLAGDDCLATLRALRRLGVRVEHAGETGVEIEGAGAHGLRAPDGPLDLGNSGTAMRLFAGLLSGQSFDTELGGDASLSRRPMARIIEPLTALGARIDSSDGRPPLVVHGGRALRGIEYELPVASAQVKSALLLAGLYADGETTVVEPAVTRDHTERMLEAMGADLEYGSGRITLPGGQALAGTDIDVPADLSSAAFPMLAGLISARGEVRIRGVGVNPTRTGVIDILRQMGAHIELTNERLSGSEPVADIHVRSSSLRGVDVDPQLVSLAIDEFPVLFVAAALAQGSSRFTGIGELRVKESDRIAAMATGLRALGIMVEESADGALVQGGSLSSGVVDSAGDHRIAMSFSVAASVAQGPVTVLNTSAVDTSFPGFSTCLEALGIDIERIARRKAE